MPGEKVRSWLRERKMGLLGGGGVISIFHLMSSRDEGGVR